MMRRFILVLMLAASPAYADRVDDNLQIMLDAARQLDPALPGDKVFLLVKQETTVAPVAIVFGYADNGAACEALAMTLSASGRDGTFKCQPI